MWSVCALEGGRVASGSADATVRVWSVATGACERTLEGHGDVVRSVCALEGGRVASGSDDSTVRVWVSGASGVIYRARPSWGSLEPRDGGRSRHPAREWGSAVERR